MITKTSISIVDIISQWVVDNQDCFENKRLSFDWTINAFSTGRDYMWIKRWDGKNYIRIAHLIYDKKERHMIYVYGSGLICRRLSIQWPHFFDKLKETILSYGTP